MKIAKPLAPMAFGETSLCASISTSISAVEIPTFPTHLSRWVWGAKEGLTAGQREDFQRTKVRLFDKEGAEAMFGGLQGWGSEVVVRTMILEWMLLAMDCRPKESWYGW